MPLTPADVHNVAFSKPPIGKRGYNEDEVDQFLDLVEDTLAQLQEENEDLRTKVEVLEKSGGGAPAGKSVDAAAIEKQTEAKVRAEYEKRLADMQAVSRKAQEELRKAQEDARAARAEAEAAAKNSGGGVPAASTAASADTHMQAARVLGLAQEMSDRLTSEAREESKTMLDEARAAAEKTINDANNTSAATMADARAKADKILTDADQRSKAMIADATQRSEAMMSEATRRSEAMIADSTAKSQAQIKQAEEKAAALKADAERKHSEIMATVKQQQSVLEGRISELRTFEREYRTRMKTLLETQLEELVSRGPAAPSGNPGNNK